MKKIGIAFGVFLLLGVVVILLLISVHTPQYEGKIKIQGLENSVEVYFDEHGIPHIYGQNEKDTYHALGYLHAQDRLFQMEMMRRVGTGTLAELLGEELVDIDRFFRTLGIPAYASITTAQLQEEYSTPWREATEAYISGVNEFIENGNLPLEYRLLGQKPRAFSINDIHAITGYMSFTFAVALKTDPLVTLIHRKLGDNYLNALSVEMLPEHHFIPNHYPDSIKTPLKTTNPSLLSLLDKLPVPQLEGSNSWVISGKKSKSGQVLFANDTHIGFSSPSVWYEAHLIYPGFEFYGNHLAGVPFGLVGHSRHHSIGLTMFENDDQDFFELELDPKNPNAYKYGEEYLPFEILNESITVKGQEPVNLEIKKSIHGPVMNGVVPEIEALTSNPVASWWVYLNEKNRALEALYRMNHAKDIHEVAQAAELIHAPGLNIMYGDSSGNIAWWAAAKLPIRSEKVHSKIFADGSDPETLPSQWYPFTENPMSINPVSGYVITANNQPDTLINGKLFPGYYYPGERWKRIADALESRNDWTINDLKDVQLETVNERSPETLRYIVGQIDRRDFEEFDAVFKYMENWKGDHQVNEIAPTIYYKLIYHIYRLSMVDEIGESALEAYLNTFMMIRSTSFFIQNEENPWWDDLNTLEKESQRDIFKKSLAITLQELEAQFGDDITKWRWEKSIIAEHPHPLGSKKPLDKIFNVKTQATPANEESINKLAFNLNGEGIYRVRSGPAMRILIDFADVARSYSVLPTGQSGNRFSPYYKDQADLFAKGKYRWQYMDRNDIIKSAGEPLILKPE
ncbi:MAG: penicillin acylase family protein [Bacteroidota bacterium]